MIRVSIVIRSHRNDAEIEMRFDSEMAKRRLRFANYLEDKFSEDLSQEVTVEDLDQLWESVK